MHITRPRGVHTLPSELRVSQLQVTMYAHHPATRCAYATIRATSKPAPSNNGCTSPGHAVCMYTSKLFQDENKKPQNVILRILAFDEKFLYTVCVKIGKELLNREVLYLSRHYLVLFLGSMNGQASNLIHSIILSRHTPKSDRSVDTSENNSSISWSTKI